MRLFDDCGRILVLGAHTDDETLGCGGTISKFIRKGYEVHVVIFSDCKDSLPDDMNKSTLRDEFFAAAKSLGVEMDRCIVLDYKVREFGYFRQSILEDLIRIKKEVKPGIVITHSTKDIHQDHKVISEESLRAFKGISILGYDLPWNCLNLEPTAFVELDEVDISCKIQALNMYQSQITLKRSYFSESYMRSIAVFRGVQNGGSLAEAYEVYRMCF